MHNVPARSGENYWWKLSDTQRAHFEKCVTAIIAYYGPDRAIYTWYTGYAVQQHLTDSPLVCAVLWRLHEELSDD